MKEKNDNRIVASEYGTFHPLPMEGRFGQDYGLDHLESRLNQPFKILGYKTAPNLMIRVIVDTSEYPAEVIPFMVMKILIDKVDPVTRGFIEDALIEEEAELREIAENNS